MKIATVLARKGAAFDCVEEAAPLTDAVRLMHAKTIGSVGVMGAETPSIIGIVSQHARRHDGSQHDFDGAILPEQGGLAVDVLDKRFQGDRQQLHLDLTHVGAGEKQEFIDNAGHPVDFLEIALKHGLIIFQRARPPQHEFRFAFHHGQRRPQLVRGVAGKLPNLPKGRVQPSDHVVERSGQPADLVGRGLHG